jgi:hypothetical protein
LYSPNLVLTLKIIRKMADYAAAVLAKGQAVVTDQYQQPEQRRQLPTIMELALQNQEISIPNAQELRTSPLRTVDVNYLVNSAAGSATAKSIAHTGSHGDSAAINVVYIQVVETFGLEQKIADNSIFQYQQLFNNRIEMCWKNLRTRQDNAALAFCVNNRCQLAGTLINPQIAAANAGTWSDTTKALEIDQTNKNLFMEYAKSMLAARFLSAPYDVIADLSIARMFAYQQRQGSGNFADLSYQFDNAQFTATQVQISSSYAQGAALIMPKGSLAGLNWNEALNRRGFDAGRGPVGFLGTSIDPLGSGAMADVSVYTARTDSSINTYGGSTQDIIDEWEFALTIGYVLPPLSAAGDSVVHLIGLTS